MILLTPDGMWANTSLPMDGAPLAGAPLYLRYPVERARLVRPRRATFPAVFGNPVILPDANRRGERKRNTRMILLTTDGRWENTSRPRDGAPRDGARLYLRYTVERDRRDRPREATLTGFLV